MHSHKADILIATDACKMSFTQFIHTAILKSYYSSLSSFLLGGGGCLLTFTVKVYAAC